MHACTFVILWGGLGLSTIHRAVVIHFWLIAICYYFYKRVQELWSILCCIWHGRGYLHMAFRSESISSISISITFMYVQLLSLNCNFTGLATGNWCNSTTESKFSKHSNLVVIKFIFHYIHCVINLESQFVSYFLTTLFPFLLLSTNYALLIPTVGKWIKLIMRT